MNKLLIATTNPGKFQELSMFLVEIPIQIVSLRDIGITDNPDEIGKTFEENAILKAKYYFQISGLPTLADDGGFEIDALGGAPGVKSHRWVHDDHESSDEELIQFTLEKIKDVPLEKRGAQLRLVLALVIPDGSIHLSEEKIRGVIPLQPTNKRTPGFPYRSLLFLPEINKYYNYNELTKEETETYNHRKKAVDRLKPWLTN